MDDFNHPENHEKWLEPNFYVSIILFVIIEKN